MLASGSLLREGVRPADRSDDGIVLPNNPEQGCAFTLCQHRHADFLRFEETFMSLVFALLLIGLPLIALVVDAFMSPATTAYRPQEANRATPSVFPPEP